MDLSEFESYAPKPRKRPCKLGAAIAGLQTDEEREQVNAALGAEHIGSGAIVKWFEVRGLEVSVSAVHYHCAGRCSCG